MRSRVALLGAAVAVLGSLTPALAGHAPTLYRQTYVMTRTASLTSPTSFNLGANWGNSISHGVHGFIGMIGVRVQKGSIASAGMFSLFETFGQEDAAEVKISGHTVRPCADYGECQTDQATFTDSFDASAQDNGESDDSNRVYVVFEGTQPASVTFSAHGWTLRKVAFTYRWLDGDQTDATQGRAHGDGAEVFTDGQLTGGKYGSL